MPNCSPLSTLTCLPPSHRREKGGGGWRRVWGQGQTCVFVFLNKHDPCGFSQGEALKKRDAWVRERKGRALNNDDTFAWTKTDERSYRRGEEVGGVTAGAPSAIHLDLCSPCATKNSRALNWWRSADEIKKITALNYIYTISTICKKILLHMFGCSVFKMMKHTRTVAKSTVCL